VELAEHSIESLSQTKDTTALGLTPQITLNADLVEMKELNAERQVISRLLFWESVGIRASAPFAR
jgi:hypothetical protein